PTRKAWFAIIGALVVMIVVVGGSLYHYRDHRKSMESPSTDEQPTQGLSSESVAASMQLLNNYLNYLDKLGFPTPTKKVNITIAPTSVGAYYDKNTIVIDPKITDDLSVALREYTHHFLVREQNWSGQYAAIESGLADYFVCSFLDNPRVGEKVS